MTSNTETVDYDIVFSVEVKKGEDASEKELLMSLLKRLSGMTEGELVEACGEIERFENEQNVLTNSIL